MKEKLEKISRILAILVLFIFPLFSYAQATPACNTSATTPAACTSGGGTFANNVCVCPSTGTPGTGTGSTGGTATNTGNCGGDPNLEMRDGICQLKKTCTAGSLACTGSLSELLVKIISMLLYFAGAIAVLFVVVGGFWYITAQGNEEQAEKGKGTLVNAVIGIIVISLAYVIVTVVANTINSPNK